LLLCSTLASVLLWAPGILAQERDYEAPPTLAAAELVSAAVLQGPHYKVDDQVPMDGLLTRVGVQSDYGRFQAVGPGMLDVRIREIGALAEKLDEVSWIRSVARITSQPELAVGQRSIYLAGRLTDLARSGLEIQGWQVHDDDGSRRCRSLLGWSNRYRDGLGIDDLHPVPRLELFQVMLQVRLFHRHLAVASVAAAECDRLLVGIDVQDLHC
jgi:hypothetical protein